MFITEFIIALVIGFIFTFVFALLYRGREGAPGFVLAFLLFFLFAWTGGIWLQPWGPPVYGVYWLPSVVSTFLIFLLIGAIIRPEPRTKKEAREQIEVRRAADTAVGFIFWIVVVALVASIVLGYVVYRA